MIARNRLIALLMRIAILALLLTGLIFYLHSCWPYHPFCFVGVQAGGFYCLCLFIAILANAIDLKRGLRGIPAGMNMRLGLPLLGACLLGALYYFFFQMRLDRTAVGFYFHLALLLLPFLEYLFFEEKGTVRLYIAFTSFWYPLIYVLYIYVRPYIFPESLFYESSQYSYSFFATGSDLTWAGVFLFLLSFLLTDLALVALNNVLSFRKRRFFYLRNGQIH